MGEQPFCVHGRLNIFVVHGLKMRDAPPSTMLLSGKMPHSGRDEDYIEAVEAVRATLTEWKRASAVDFIGGDLNIELTLDNTDGEHHGLDSIEWYGMYGPECRGGGEDTIAFEKN